MMVGAQHDVDQILGTVRILEGEHLRAAASEVHHGFGRRSALQGLIAAGQLGVSLLQQGGPVTRFFLSSIWETTYPLLRLTYQIFSRIRDPFCPFSSQGSLL